MASSALEGDEDAPPDAGRVLDALEAGRDLGPFVVAEVGVGRARGEHEIVVGDAHRIDLHEPFASINGADLGHQHGRVLLLAQNVADRPGDVGRRERRGRDLVEHRLEAMMILPVDHGDLDRRSA